MQEVTIGGDRIGAGKKMKAEMHGYERSTHDRGFVFRSTMSAGTLVPFLKEIALPGDTFDIDLNCDVKTHPTVGPLFGSFKVQLDIFQCPIRLYHAWLHNNKLGIGRKMSNVKFPKIKMPARNSFAADPKLIDQDNNQINPSCIFSYLGIRGVGTYKNIAAVAGERFMNATAWIAYWDIVKNYYANKQEEIAAVIHTGRPTVPHNVDEIMINGNLLSALTPGAPRQLTINSLIQITDTGTAQEPEDILLYIVDDTNELRWIPLLTIATLQSTGVNLQVYRYNNTLTNAYAVAWAYTDEADTPQIRVHTFPLENLDNIREEILLHSTYPAPFVLSSTSAEPFNLPLLPTFGPGEEWRGSFMLTSQEGLALKTYQSDILNNWISKEWIDGAQGISAMTAIDTSGGSFTMDTLLVTKKVYDVLNRVAMSGGTLQDWRQVVYDHKSYAMAYSPIYHGGLSKELVFQEVVSNSSYPEINGGNIPLGTLAGKGVMAQKHKGGKVTIKVDEESYIIGIVSLTPRLDYSQGNDWDVDLDTLDDLHKPGYDQIGFQELITEKMAWWDTNYDLTTNEWVKKSAGKQPAWINYMTNINRTRGNFAIKDSEMFMTLNRGYEPFMDMSAPDNPTEIKDVTTYIDPQNYNFIFADTALDSQNFWVQIGVDMKVRSKMSAKVMPNL